MRFRKATKRNGCALTRARLTTTNGSVTFRVPRTASVAVSARTTNGSIAKGGFPGSVKSDGGLGHSFDGMQNGGRANVELRSDYGSVAISVR